MPTPDLSPPPTRAPGRWRRRVRVVVLSVVGVLAGLELAWLLAARVALGGTWLRAQINAHPEELEADWRAASSGWPGRVRLEGFRIRGQDGRDQWYGEAEHADLVVRLLPLLSREVVGDRVHLRGVRFRLRPRLDRVPAGSVDPAHLPEIPGLENPPVVPPPPESDAPSTGRHWAIRLPGIRVEDLRELWINEASLSGSGRLRGRLDYRIRGPFETEVLEFDMPGARVRAAGETLSTNLAVTLSGVLGPLRFSETKGPAYYGKLTARVGLSGPLSAGSLLSRHLGRTDSMEVLGGGRVDLQLAVRSGRLEGPGQATLDSPDLAVRLGNVFIRGSSRVAVEVAGSGGASVSTLNLDLRGLRFSHREDQAEAVDSGDLRLRAVVHDPEVPGGFRDVEVGLKLGPLVLPEAGVLNGFLPRAAGGRFLGGGFRLAADYTRPRIGPGTGRLEIDGRELRFQLGNREFGGRVGVETGFALGTNRVLEFGPAAIVATNISMTGVASRQPDGWHGRVEADHGQVTLAGPTEVVVEPRLALLDTRPLLALLREDEDSPGWLRFVPNLKDLHGSLRLSIRSNDMVVRDLHLRGAATEVLAQLTLRDGGPEGILYARYGLISAGFDFRPDGRDWTVFGAKRKYQRRLAELKLEGALLPEGEDTDGEHRPGGAGDASAPKPRGPDR